MNGFTSVPWNGQPTFRAHSGFTDSDLQLEQAAIVTGYVLGQRQQTQMLTELILPIQSVGGKLFQYETVGSEYLEEVDTERADGAPYATSTWTRSSQTAQIYRYSFATSEDYQTVTPFAEPSLRLDARNAAFARSVVRQNRERIRAAAIFDGTAYPAAHTVDITGTEFNSVGGDVFATVSAGIQALMDAHGGNQMSIEAYSSWNVLNAIRRAPDVIAWWATSGRGRNFNESDLAE